MESMENQPCIFLGIKVKPGPIERHKLENFALDNTIELLRNEAEKRTNLPSASLELIHHGKVLKDNSTLIDNGVKIGEMVHVVKKKMQPPPTPPPTYTDAELQQLNTSLRTLGCTPNAPGWTRAMQLLNDESAMADIIEQAPSLGEDCMTLSILHEVELLAALGANLQTMRRGAEAHPDLPNALRHLMRLVRSSSNAATADNTPTSGFAYSLEALSEDEDVEEEETEENEARSAITQEQLAAALQAATEAVLSPSARTAGGAIRAAGHERRLLRLLQAAAEPNDSSAGAAGVGGVSGRGGAITAEMFSEAISAALTRTPPAPPPFSELPAGTPMDQSTAASSSQSPVTQEPDYSAQLQHMHEMGLVEDALNVRALIICAGDVNAAINLVFSGAIGEY